MTLLAVQAIGVRSMPFSVLLSVAVTSPAMDEAQELGRRFSETARIAGCGTVAEWIEKRKERPMQQGKSQRCIRYLPTSIR